MGRKTEKNHQIGWATCQQFMAVWIVSTPYIHVYLPGYSGDTGRQIKAAAQRGNYLTSVHVLGTQDDLNDERLPSGGRTPNQYVKDELTAFVEEDGQDYLAAAAGGYL